MKERVTGEELRSRLEAAKITCLQERVRWLVGKQYLLETAPNAFGEKIEEEKLKDVIRETGSQEYRRQRILLALQAKPASCIEVALKLGLTPDSVLRDMVVLRRKGLIDVGAVEERNPIYVKL